ncbi:MAG: FAD-dependent monooxygenase [Hyphomicrobiaceae bacterium]|nr:FAD-dependent monooxygenase [Hyphomicrobiaceae bacterium]
MKVVIAGAGIAGLSAALFLARNDIGSLVFERAPELKEVGAGLQLGPNATRVLLRLGLGDQLRHFGVAPRAIDVLDGPSGERLVLMDLSDVETRYGAPYLTIHRADLQAILAEAVRRNHATDVWTDHEVKGITKGGNGIVLTNGHVEHGDVIVGADGVWSKMRQKLRGSGPPTYTGYASLRTTISAELAPHLPRDRVQLRLSPNAHIVAYPMRGGEEVNLVINMRTNDPSELGPGDAHALVENWPEDIRHAVTATQAWRAWPLNGVSPTKAWTNGKHMALIGDAAHAMLPFMAQGAGMAIEDACCLAACIADLPLDEAMTTYEQVRMPRVNQVVKAAQLNGRTYHLSGPLAKARNAGFKVMTGERLIRRFDWVYDYDAETASRFRPGQPAD